MHVTIIGIGPGHPDQITVQAVNALNAHDVILLPTKAGTTTGDTRRSIAQRHLVNPDAHRLIDLPMPSVRNRPRGAYRHSVQQFREQQAAAIAAALDALDVTNVAILTWGCPTLFDGTIEGVRTYPGVQMDVIPGVTSVSALAAAHGVAQTEIGQSVLITTGRQLQHGLPANHGTVVDMVDAKGHVWTQDPAGWTAYWGAFVGLAQEELDHGPLDEMQQRIPAKRAELAETHGWLFDVTLLRQDHQDQNPPEPDI
ncbi:SAM-dependent methyltransferase [Stomatohabitans albus]|uniref:SAM-dependent methyltransferase n=1 Tax=Stomatohabitans albus TaxID=3110766 RepID=UPI00300D4243